MLLYWGRRGALSRFTLELARVATSTPGVQASVSVSRQNEAYDAFASIGSALFAVDTFRSAPGALANVRRFTALRRALADRLAVDRTDAVVALMPHVWSQLVIDVVRGAGARYITVVHDAVPHQGERGSLLHRWLLREAAAADHVLTLSRSVAAQLARSGRVPPDRISTSFLPEISYGSSALRTSHATAGPLKLLFFGRVLPYKGLSRLVTAVERVRARGRQVELGVFGEGDLEGLGPRLQALGATVVNRWIAEGDVATIFERHDAVVLSHSEASQSGVAAAAFGIGLPVIALPVGGLVEQVTHGETGLVAARPDLDALVDAITQLADDPELLRHLRAGVARTHGERSMTRFLDTLVTIAAPGTLSQRLTA